MSDLLETLGLRIRAERLDQGLTLKALADLSGLSLRFLSDLEKGKSNVSITRLDALAGALRVDLIRLLHGADPAYPKRLRTAVRKLATLGADAMERVTAVIDREALDGELSPVVALLGVRGAGKSTVGRRVAALMGVEFVELDHLIEQASGLSLGDIFSIHGEAYYRSIELEVLKEFLDGNTRAVVATGGSLVTHEESFELLQGRAQTIWLSARAQDHWERVLGQGDDRPMRRNPQAFDQLESLLSSRRALYALADTTVDTSQKEVYTVVNDVLRAVGQAGQLSG
jgi:XRE family transcriptional regulator, aerobic/anaerobic benzoate catabolism transcriptional regulator